MTRLVRGVAWIVVALLVPRLVVTLVLDGMV
jgi:hypothetical protein